jgi:hypothetical protein
VSVFLVVAYPQIPTAEVVGFKPFFRYARSDIRRMLRIQQMVHDSLVLAGSTN